MNTLTRILLAGNLVFLTALVGLFGWQLFERDRQARAFELERQAQAAMPQDQDPTMRMIAALDERLERYRNETLKPGDIEPPMSAEALREAIKQSVEEALEAHAEPVTTVASDVPLVGATSMDPQKSLVPTESLGTVVQSAMLTAPVKPVIQSMLASTRPAESLGAAAAELPASELPLAPGEKRRLTEVHFSHGSASLSPGAEKKTREAIAALGKLDVSKIRVVGFTDTTGTDEQNLALSRQRASAVADMLVQYGISPERIEVVGRGEAPGPMPTGDGVDEPLNRCVGIIAVNQ
ncbi:MAG: OmpA family protein [Gammaproteobacteria bacterium]|nr:OmpA family protein [Gammaproteobacteria bacterium]